MKSIGVIGVGRLGICTALVLEKAGFHVVCYDVNTFIREAIQTRYLESPEKGVTEMLAKATNIEAVDSLEKVLTLDVLFCVVATPSLPDGSYNHTYIDNVVTEMIEKLSVSDTKKILNICCTTMPGYCESVQKRFSDKYLAIDVCYNPEFIAQGDVLHGFTHPDILLIGENSTDAGDKLVSIYNTFLETTPSICRMTCTEAEITKISINCFITTKISFANTIGDLCIQQELNPDRVLHAIGGDSRIGRKYLNWGHGYGGPCFPRDNRALCFHSKNMNVSNLIGEATDTTNSSHLDFLVHQCSQLAKQSGKPFLFRDLAYKPGTLILEESQSYALAQKLDLEGFSVFVQESDGIKKEVEKINPTQFLFVEKNVDESKYIVVDRTLSCLRGSV